MERRGRFCTQFWVVLALVLLPPGAVLAGSNIFEQVGDLAHRRTSGTPWAGRLSVVAPVPTNPATIFVGSTNGGVWRTIDGGSTWETRTDKFSTLEISALATDNAGTRVFAATLYPTRLLRSFDGGNTWGEIVVPQVAFLTDRISKLVVDPVHANTLYAQTTRGLMRSPDDGTTWEVVFPPSDRHVAGLVLLAGGQFWVVVSRGGIPYRSPSGDAGTFLEIVLPSPSDGQPPFLGTFPNLRLAQVPGQPNRIFLVYGGVGDAIYRSDSYGAAPVFVSRNQMGISPRSFAASGDGTTLYVGQHSSGNASLNRARNQGQDWDIPFSGKYHPDIMALASLASPNRLYVATDGGLWRLDEQVQAEPWVNLNGNMANLLLYNVYASRGDKDAIVGGTQDNGAIVYRGQQWTVAIGGDFGDGFLRRDDVQTGGTMATIGSDTYAHIDGDVGSISVSMDGLECDRPAGGEFAIAPDNPTFVCVATGPIHCTFNGGRDPWCLETSDLGALEIVMVDSQTAWARTLDAKVIRTSTGMAGPWVDVTGDLPGGQIIGIDAPEGGDPQHALVLAGSPTQDPLVYETTNGGASWTPLGVPPIVDPGGIPPECFTPPCSNAPEGNPYLISFGVNFAGLLYNEAFLVGTSHGLLESGDRGATWHDTNLPNVQVRDIDTYRAIATVATHGRGVWQRDIGPEFPDIYEVAHDPFWWLKNSPVELIRWASDLIRDSGDLIEELRQVAGGGRAFRRGDEAFGAHDFPIVAGTPFLSKATRSTVTTLEGAPAAAQTVVLERGWNPIGVPDGLFASASDVLADLGTQGIAAQAIADGGGAQGYQQVGARADQVDFGIVAAEGYWVYVCGDGGAWTPGAGAAGKLGSTEPGMSPASLSRQPAANPECPGLSEALAELPLTLSGRMPAEILACVPHQFVTADRISICDTPPPVVTDRRNDNDACALAPGGRGCAVIVRPVGVVENAAGGLTVPFTVESNGTATLPDGTTCAVTAADDVARMVFGLATAVDPPVILVDVAGEAFEDLQPQQAGCGANLDLILGDLIRNEAELALSREVSLRVTGLGPVCSPTFPLPDADLDGTPDCNDGCPADPLKTDPGACGCGAVDDADGDGRIGCLDDCNDADPAVWAVPGEVRNLLLHDDGTGATHLDWWPPLSPGGAGVLYDTLMASQPAGFLLGAACVESDDGADTMASTATIPQPGAVEHFLIRAGNRCGEGTPGAGSDGVERAARACP